MIRPDTSTLRGYLKTMGAFFLIASIISAIYCLSQFSTKTVISEYYSRTNEVFSYLGLTLASVSILGGCLIHSVLLGLSSVLELLEYNAQKCQQDKAIKPKQGSNEKAVEVIIE